MPGPKSPPRSSARARKTLGGAAPARPAPSIYRYLDFRQWAGDWFSWKKDRNSNFSHRRFAQIAGLAPGTLQNILAGRRSPSPDSVARIALAARLSGDETAFFKNLVLLSVATVLEVRNRALEVVLNHPQVREVRRLEGAYVAYLSNWYHVAIRELARIPGFQEDPAWIVERLAHRVSREQVAAALVALRELGLLVRDAGGRLTPAETRLETPPQVAGLAFFRHHEEMLALSGSALHTIDAQERYYGAVTLTLPSGRVAELRNETLSFLRSTMNSFDQPIAPPD